MVLVFDGRVLALAALALTFVREDQNLRGLATTFKIGVRLHAHSLQGMRAYSRFLHDIISGHGYFLHGVTTECMKWKRTFPLFPCAWYVTSHRLL